MDSVFMEIEECLNDFEQNGESDLLCERMDVIITFLRHVLPTLHAERFSIVDEVLRNLSALKAVPEQNNHLLPADTPVLDRLSEVETIGRGRPRMNISRETLLGLRNMGNSWASIARMLSVSKWTIYRRARYFEIQNIGMFSIITDEELSEIIENFLQQQSRLVGFPLVYGYIQSIGIHVQQLRVKNCLRRVDPTFNVLRWATVIHRRVYNVRAPNSLWHIDGHHSLIKWGFVIHGSIDGFSRMITFLKCSSNNRSSTVLDLFENSISLYGTPSRIRTDHGGENVLIWNLMETLRGENRGSALQGTSTQNQRIERLWRDVFRCVCSTFYYLFQSMEDSGVLQTDSYLHMFILHFIFKPRINHSLKLFTDAWNHHPVRTAGSKSPVRIWQNGMLDIRNRSLNTVQDLAPNEEVIEDLEWYGYDPNVPARPRYVEELDQVIVDDLLDDYEHLQRYLLEHVFPLQQSDLLGVDLYIESLQICQRLIEEI